MAKLTESLLRRIIKEELLEMMGTISSDYALDEADRSGLKSKVMSAVKGKSGGMSVAALAKRLGVSEKEIKGVSRSGGLELVGDKVQAYQSVGDEEDDE
jgi:hypothetical protein